MAAALYTNNAETTLNGAITDVATSITVTDGSVFPTLSGGDYFWLTITDNTNIEIVKVTARSTHVLTVERGQDGTSGTAFADGDKAQLRLTAVGLSEFAQLGEDETVTGDWNFTNIDVDTINPNSSTFLVAYGAALGGVALYGKGVSTGAGIIAYADDHASFPGDIRMVGTGFYEFFHYDATEGALYLNRNAGAPNLALVQEAAGNGASLDLTNSADSQTWRVTGALAEFKIRNDTGAVDAFAIMPDAPDDALIIDDTASGGVIVQHLRIDSSLGGLTFAPRTGSNDFQIYNQDGGELRIWRGSDIFHLDTSGNIDVFGTNITFAADGILDTTSDDIFIRPGSARYRFRDQGAAAELRIYSDNDTHDAALYFGGPTDEVQAGFYYDESTTLLQLRGYNNNTIGYIGPTYFQIGSNGNEEDFNMHVTSSATMNFFYSGSQMGDFSASDTTWFRINQTASKNIYTPRMIRADGGFQVDGLEVVQSNADLIATDNKYIHIGTGADLNIHSNGTNVYFDHNASSILYWRNSSGTTKFLFHPNSNYLRFQDSARADFGSGNDFRMFHNGSNMYSDMYTGDWYVRDSTTNRFLFNDTGAFSATSNITAYASISDINAKENVAVIVGALDKVRTLDGITYNYIGDPEPMTGVIAQQVRKVLPEAVYDLTQSQQDFFPSRGKMAVRHGNMVGLLIEAIKELEARVKELEDDAS